MTLFKKKHQNQSLIKREKGHYILKYFQIPCDKGKYIIQEDLVLNLDKEKKIHIIKSFDYLPYKKRYTTLSNLIKERLKVRVNFCKNNCLEKLHFFYFFNYHYTNQGKNIHILYRRAFQKTDYQEGNFGERGREGQKKHCFLQITVFCQGSVYHASKRSHSGYFNGLL